MAVHVAVIAAVAAAAARTPTDLAVDAYSFLYPLMVMHETQVQSGGVPNKLINVPAFIPPSIHKVVRPNEDTLYSIAWLNISAGPVVLEVPDTDGRYYLFQMMSAYSDTFASPGARTTGTKAGKFVVVGPRYDPSSSPQLPAGATVLNSTTEDVWVLGRTQCDGPSDYPAVRAIQAGYKLTPLAAWRDDSAVPRLHTTGPAAAAADPPPPPDVVAAMNAETFFTTACSLLARNPPTAADAPFIAAVFAPLGLPSNGAALAWSALPAATQKSLNDAVPVALAAVRANSTHLPGSETVDGWEYGPSDVGSYGTHYALRAAVALNGLGANLPEDAIYIQYPELSPGQQFELTFKGDAMPPVNAFWSITAYNNAGYLEPNAQKVYALHGWDALVPNADGGVTLAFGDKIPRRPIAVQNWLPAPANGKNWSLQTRLYWPKDAALSRAWRMPALVVAQKTPSQLPQLEHA